MLIDQDAEGVMLKGMLMVKCNVYIRIEVGADF